MPLYTVEKEILCHPCALRMSMLFQFPPPLNYQRSQNTDTENVNRIMKESVGLEVFQYRPIFDDTYHERFVIVHESAHSALRCFRGQRLIFGNMASANCGAYLSPTESTVSVAEDLGTLCHIQWLCVACFGLYQFMDHIHAPMIAARVRQSRFADSSSISININISRSLTFTWLAVATRYYDRYATMVERPAPSAIIPEEFSNFKELYMSDLRARVLQYLVHSHSEIVRTKGTSIQGLAVYLKLLGAKIPPMEAEESKQEEPDAKARRLENIDEKSILCICPQKFIYNTSSEHLICDVYCCHCLTESLLSHKDFPKQYASNKSGGMILTYSIIYDYVIPQLDSIRCSSFPLPQDDVASNWAKSQKSATITCTIAHANIFLQGSYCKMQRNLPQSPWFVNGSRVGFFSLQEIIAGSILPFFFPEGVASVNDTEGNQIIFGEPEIVKPKYNKDLGVGDLGHTVGDAVNPVSTSTQEVFGHGRYKFHSAGREDIDVRMLGSGRPFVLEIVNPTSEAIPSDDLLRMMKRINKSHKGSVEVCDLRFTDASVTVRLARHSESKLKRYRCVVWSSRAIEDPSTDAYFHVANATKDLEIEQKTPLRVLHRRSLHTRSRTIHSIQLTSLNAHWFILELETQAGTYVKEFVHGDMGRTTPNLGMLLRSRMDIIQLDVMGMTKQDLD